MKLADSHIHLFRGGYSARYGPAFARGDELALYETFRRLHDIEVALVVGYEEDERFHGNNRDIAKWARRHEWIRPLEFRATDNPPMAPEKEECGYVGIALYAMTARDAQRLCDWPGKAFDLLNAERAIVSINARPEALAALRPFAECLDECSILISHLGLPGAYATPPSSAEARARLEPLRNLAALGQVGVKLSGLYAASDPSHDYPHRAAHPFLNEIWHDFGPRRLYWGSDFSPALEHVSFAQAVDALSHMEWDAASMEAVMGGNLLALLGEG